MKTNMIDAGHGGYDSGAPGVHGCLEKNIVLEVANKVNDYLKTQNIKNINTRTTDVFLTLNERSNKANNLGVNSFVSIHCNSSDNPKAHGLEIFCYKFKYRHLADCILQELKNENLYTQLREGGIKEGNLHVVRETNMDACLVELGFITNEEDYNLIMNNKDRFAKAIAKGICKFNGVTWKESSNTTSNEGFKNRDYSGRKARVIADVLNIRYDRGTQYNVIGQVKNGDIVNLQYCLNGWISIEG
ncbi:N-acetylmuramoyl-L-alanine amidase, partial [Paraclostridium sordellii]|uniref:N-acetylmuramoyl-L-alanine amidase n=1 Tax=Paraclostridium sordellii TaxID=1505 RepID=UPI0006DD33B6